jgi:hypothetical protein
LASVCHGSPFLRARGSFSRLPGRSNQVEIFCFTCRGGMAIWRCKLLMYPIYLCKDNIIFINIHICNIAI